MIKFQIGLLVILYVILLKMVGFFEILSRGIL